MVKPTLLRDAAKVGFEPILTDAALCLNVRTSWYSQKRDKMKENFAKSLWHKVFQWSLIRWLVPRTTSISEFPQFVSSVSDEPVSIAVKRPRFVVA